MKKKTEKPKKAYSKSLLDQESALIWILSVSFIVLAFYCVRTGYEGALPWLTITLTGAWTAYGVSQAMYYKKSERENTAGGIVYESAMKKLEATIAESNPNNGNVDFE